MLACQRVVDHPSVAKNLYARPVLEPEKLSPGVDFPSIDGRISTTAIGQQACAIAAGAVDTRVAARIDAIQNWRSEYITPYRQLTELAATSAQAALDLSRAGLDYLWDSFVFRNAEGELPLRDLTAGNETFRTQTVIGSKRPVTELVVPYQGRRLRGDELLTQLDDWVANGLVEPGFAQAISKVARNPEWLNTSDLTTIVLGAGAEMGPLVSLLRWGGHVMAVDLPRPALWQRVISQVRESAGTLDVPVRIGAGRSGDDTGLAEIAGVNLIEQTPEVLTWLREASGPTVVGNYLYADSGLHVRVSMAADFIGMGLNDGRDLTLAYLATPTDAFAVPWRDVEISRNRWRHRRTRLVQGPLHLIGGFKKNYAITVTDANNRRVGIADCLVPQQGPNYALAKRLQRWRAVDARAHGIRVSLNVAPATRTRSVVKNRALAAAYAGAHRFGIHVFEPSTANTLMAAMLVHDLRNPRAAANPKVLLGNPMDLFSESANHGGLWTTGYEPRSVLGFAAGLGMFESRA